MTNAPSMELLGRLAQCLGPKGFTCDPAEMEPLLVDWRGRYRGRAAAMLSPSSTEEVAEIVRLCAEAEVAIVPQGGNSSMVGGATPDAKGEALLLSTRRMNRIRSLSTHANIAVCEAGVILSNLHEAAAQQGRRFPLSLGAKGTATIGGLVSTNAGGTQVLRFGTMRSLVAGIEAVLPDGSVYASLAPLRKDNRGYDLKQILIGAEGTLGIVTAASLRLYPAAAGRSVAWIGLSSPKDALRLLRLLEERTGEAVESFELIPDNALKLVLAHVPGTRAPLGGNHGWHVLVEATAPAGGPNPAHLLEEGLAASIAIGIVEDAVIAANEVQADAFWRIRDSISEAERKQGPAAKHDVSIAVDMMPDFIIDAAGKVEQRFPSVEVIAFGHLGDGNVHFNVTAPPDAAAEWLETEGKGITSYVHDLVVAAEGSISAEHGIGQMRLSELGRLGGSARLSAMRVIKQALDPNGIMNPGKLVELA
jgi:FAD/FMN-containing dehydrogenase